MTKTFLIASVAALAISAPAQAERGKGGGQQSAEQTQKAEAPARKQRAERAQKTEAPARQQQRAERAQKAEAPARAQRVERAPRVQPQMREQRVERAPKVRAQRVERSVERTQAPIFERRSRDSARRIEARPQRIERQVKADSNRALTRARTQERVVERRARTIEDRSRIASQRTQSRERIAAKRIEQDNRRAERLATKQLRQQNRQAERLSRAQQRAIQPRLDDGQPLDIRQQQIWTAYANRFATVDDDRREIFVERPLARVGTRIDPDWYDDYVPLRYRTTYYDTPDYYYRYDYDDGYLYRVDRDNDFVMGADPAARRGLFGRPAAALLLPERVQRAARLSQPLLRHAGLLLPLRRQCDLQVDPATQLIQGIVALLTGQSLGIGQRLPLGYDVYNVPYAYRSNYFDSDDMWYRYDDGYIYGVDPRTRLIETMIPAYDGNAVGYPAPLAFAGYDYDVPDYYDDLYYAEPGYDYRYASGGIYQIDPTTQLVAALVALVTGQSFNVGQRMPLGYDVYNVPFAYRDQYYDRTSICTAMPTGTSTRSTRAAG